MRVSALKNIPMERKLELSLSHDTGLNLWRTYGTFAIYLLNVSIHTTLTNFSETRIFECKHLLVSLTIEKSLREMDIAMTSLADGTLGKALLWRLAADPHHA